MSEAAPEVLRRSVSVRETVRVHVSADYQQERTVELGSGVLAHAWDAAASVEMDQKAEGFSDLLKKRRADMAQQWEHLNEALVSVVDQMEYLRSYARVIDPLLEIEGNEPLGFGDDPDGLGIKWLDAEPPDPETGPLATIAAMKRRQEELEAEVARLTDALAKQPALPAPAPETTSDSEVTRDTPQAATPSTMGRPPKYTEEQREAIRQRYAAGGVSTHDLSKEFGIPVSSVQNIVREAKAPTPPTTAPTPEKPAGAWIPSVPPEPFSATHLPPPPRVTTPLKQGQVACADCGRPVTLPVARDGANRCMRCHGAYVEMKHREKVVER